MWRFCHNSHPLRVNLKRRGVVLDTRCVVCSRLDEDGAHLFFKCKHMVKVWNLLSMDHVRTLLASKTSATEVTETIMTMKDDQRALCCIVLWLCWSERNRIREGEPKRDPGCLAHSARCIAGEWCCQKPQAKEVRQLRVQRWEKPDGDNVKVNCDAAFHPTTRNGGWGCIIRDLEGDVVMTLRGRVEALLNPLHGELIACLQGAQAALATGVGHLIETDASTVMKAVYSSEYDMSEVGHLVEELRRLREWNFIKWKVQFQPRSCNRVAHELAQLGSVCNPDESFVLASVPANISRVIADDSAPYE